MVDAGKGAEFLKSFSVRLGRAAACGIDADDGNYRQQQTEVGRAFEQAEVADRLVVHVADRAGAGLLVAADGTQGAGAVGDADAVEGIFGGRSRQALGERCRIGVGRLRDFSGERSSGNGARLRLVEHWVFSFAWPGSRGAAISSGAVLGWVAQCSPGPVLVCRDAA